MSDTKERIKRLARFLKAKVNQAEVKVEDKEVAAARVVKSEQNAADLKDEVVATQAGRKAKLEKRIADLKTKIQAAKGKKAEADSVVGGGDTDKSDQNTDYAEPTPKPEFADKKDLEKAKDDAIDSLTPSMKAEDVRDAYKKAIKLAWARFAKNLESPNKLKSAMYAELTESFGFKNSAAIGVIETVFEKAAAETIDTILRRADEFSDYSPEAVAELDKEVQLTCIMVPTDTEEEETAEEEETTEEEERMVEGSFRMPKSASTGEKEDLLARAVPKYVKL